VSTFEDDIRRAMTDHDDEAPREADLLRSLEQASPPRRRRGGWYVPFAVAVAVAAVVLGSVSVGRLLAGHQQEPVLFSQGTAQAASPGTTPAARLSCPARYAKQAPWVPAKPADVDGRSRLVPQQAPRSALICAYAGSNMAKQQAGWALSGRRSLTGNLAGLAAQLSWQARLLPSQQVFCAGVGGRQTNYLIGLTYPGGGTMWVAATDEPGECVSASNGEFTSTSVIGPKVSKAFASGRWPVRSPAACDQRFPDIGRLGEDTSMVPVGATALTICTAGKASSFTSGYQALIRALDRLPTQPSTSRCSPSPSSSADEYQLLFSYREGPLVSVDIAVGCYPEVGNLNLQSHSASSVLPLLRQLLKTK
jgi:hypothetical protein